MGLIRSTIAAAKARAAAGWRLYRRVPWPLRWPATILIAVFLAVIVANLVFGASRQIVRQELSVAAGTTERVTIQVDAGRNVEVLWEQPAGATAAPLAALLRGPDERQATEDPLIEGRFLFKGGFSRATYRLELRNESAVDTELVRVRWTVR